jgi:pimeloyl-ACP methyl ester carboxylesterase
MFAITGCPRRPPAVNNNAVVPDDVVVIDPEEVTFATSDGWTLHADLRLRATRNGLGVVFVHQLSSNRGEWAAFAAQVSGPARALATSGISTLTVDLRGHGQSTQSPQGTVRWESFGNDRAQWMGLEQDVAAAVDYLRQRAATTRIAIVGSSIGSTAAALYGARPGVPVVSLALLSPGSAYRGIDLLAPLRTFATQTHGRVFAAAAAGDLTSADCVNVLERQLQGDAGAALRVVRFDNSSAHGVTMGAQGEHPELWTQLQQWLNDQR